MQGPNSPSVPPSEPEVERRIVEHVLEDVERNAFDGVQIYLPYAKEYLNEHGLDVDDEGFIVDAKTREYAVPYVFVDELVREYVKEEDETIFDAFFRPVTHDRVYGWDNERLHLSDLHAVAQTETGAHPVRDGTFDIAELHARLETGFRVMTGWSDIVKREGVDESGQWLCLAKGFDGSDNAESLVLNCLSVDCEYSGPLAEWDGDTDVDPECPECGGKWDADSITVCTLCERWHWGTYFAGESLYAEPACPNCEADMEYLTSISRYDDVESLEAVAEAERPSYTVVGLDDDGDVAYTFDHTETKNEAEQAKSHGERMAGSAGFEEITEVEIRERDPVECVTHYERNDDQPT